MNNFKIFLRLILLIYIDLNNVSLLLSWFSFFNFLTETNANF